MKLPEKVSLKMRAHGHGAKGMAFYTYQDVEGLGVLCDSRRASGREPFVETWRFAWLPDETFADLGALVERLRVVPDEAIAAEKAIWPRLGAVTDRGEDPPTGSCWLHPDRPATHTAFAATCWFAGAGVLAILCSECATAAADDASVVTDAGSQRESDVAARKIEGKSAE